MQISACGSSHGECTSGALQQPRHMAQSHSSQIQTYHSPFGCGEARDGFKHVPHLALAPKSQHHGSQVQILPSARRRSDASRISCSSRARFASAARFVSGSSDSRRSASRTRWARFRFAATEAGASLPHFSILIAAIAQSVVDRRVNPRFDIFLFWIVCHTTTSVPTLPEYVF